MHSEQLPDTVRFQRSIVADVRQVPKVLRNGSGISASHSCSDKLWDDLGVFETAHRARHCQNTTAGILPCFENAECSTIEVLSVDD